MVTGTVKWFRLIKGLSFITLDESGPDAFVHIPGIGRTGLTTLQEGQRVNFDLQSGRNGKNLFDLYWIYLLCKDNKSFLVADFLW